MVGERKTISTGLVFPRGLGLRGCRENGRARSPGKGDGEAKSTDLKVRGTLFLDLEVASTNTTTSFPDTCMSI